MEFLRLLGAQQPDRDEIERADEAVADAEAADAGDGCQARARGLAARWTREIAARSAQTVNDRDTSVA